MPTSEKYMVTRKQQAILWFLYRNKNPITFEDQNVYFNRRSFNKAMRNLVNAKWLKIKSKLIKGKYRNTYSLTMNGILVIEEVFKQYSEYNVK